MVDFNPTISTIKTNVNRMGKKMGKMQNGLKKKKDSTAKSLNHVQLFATLWIVACQAPLSM